MAEITAASDRALLVVAGAMIGAEGRVLLQRRPEGTTMAGLWEFPGGKVEAGESPDDALVRELREELAVDVEPRAIAPLTFTCAWIGSRPLVLLLYVMRRWRGVPQAVEAPELRWVAPAEMGALPMPPADGPLVAALVRHCATESHRRG